MSLSEFSDYLNKLQEMLPHISNKISDDEFYSNLQNTTQKMIELIPATQKTLKDSQNLLEAFSSWQRENERLQKVLLALGMSPAIPLDIGISSASQDATQNAEEIVATDADDKQAAPENDQQTAMTNSESEQVTDRESEQENTDGESGQENTDGESQLSAEGTAQETACANDEQAATTNYESEHSENKQESTDSESEQLLSEEPPTAVDEEKKPALTKIDANTLEESKDSFSNAPLDISPSSTEEDKPQVTISTPQKHRDSVENKHLYFSEDEVMKELQIDVNELEAMVEEKKLTATIIEEKKYFSKKKVSLLRSVAMESSTVVIEKPVKQPLIFGGSKKETTPKQDTKDYYNEDEVMEELQTDLDGLEKMIEQKKLIPTMIDGKRYFPKRKVALLRSMAMELSTIVIQKPKKKNPLNFWKDN